MADYQQPRLASSVAVSSRISGARLGIFEGAGTASCFKTAVRPQRPMVAKFLRDP